MRSIRRFVFRMLQILSMLFRVVIVPFLLFWPFLTIMIIICRSPSGDFFYCVLQNWLDSGYLNLNIIFVTLAGLILAAGAIGQSRNIKHFNNIGARAVGDLYRSLIFSLAGFFTSLSLGLYAVLIKYDVICYFPSIWALTLYFKVCQVILVIATAVLMILAVGFMYLGAGWLLIRDIRTITHTPVSSFFGIWGILLEWVFNRVRGLFMKGWFRT